jgi:tetratricopeptide (TPR) repeat protein
VASIVLAAALVAPLPAPAPPASAPPSGACSLRPSGESPRIPGVPFEELVQRADAADAAGRVEEAVRFYRGALDLDPRWHDGWWRLGLLLSDAGCPEAAREASRRVVDLKPRGGPGWGLLGLSELQAGDRERAFEDLSRAVALGMASAPDLGRRGLHGLTLLLIGRGDFASAARYLTILVRIEPGDPELVLASGLAALRLPRLPSDLSPDEKAVAEAAGRAAYAMLVGRTDEGHRLFDALLSEFPDARGVHYAYGRVLSREGSPRALAMLRQETDIHPDHAEAWLEVALETLERGGDPAEALAAARTAARLQPDSFWSRLALGRALLASGDAGAAVVELERAAALSPDARDVYVALAQAYARAGRPADVERTRETLLRLDRAQPPGR